MPGRLKPLFLAFQQIVEFCDELHESAMVRLVFDPFAKPIHLLTLFRSQQASRINGWVAFFKASLRT